MNFQRIVNILISICLASVGLTAQNIPSVPEAILKLDSISVLVIDSGLGGLSVVAGIERLNDEQGQYRTIRVTFCNALPSAGHGYNDMITMEEKASIFSASLKGMIDCSQPDFILIACNTLSVVYPRTSFAKTASIPIVGIVELGAEMIAHNMKMNPDAYAIIFGTETTIRSETHRVLLAQAGIDTARILTQACPRLESEIQIDPHSEVVQSFIEIYIEEAMKQLKRTDIPIVAALCCTHYGYSMDLFKSTFTNLGVKRIELLNPNDRLSAILFVSSMKREKRDISFTAKVYSRVQFSDDEIAAISRLLEKEAPLTAQALRTYRYDAKLF